MEKTPDQIWQTIQNDLTRLLTKMEFFAERIVRLENKLDTHYASKESLKALEERVKKAEDTVTWAMRGIIAGAGTSLVSLIIYLAKT